MGGGEGATALVPPAATPPLQKMMRYCTKPVHLILDGLPAHKTALVKKYIASTYLTRHPGTRHKAPTRLPQSQSRRHHRVW